MKSNAKPSRCPWSLFSAVLLTLAAFSVPMHGQEAANTVGYSEDWSSHHVVFSNPGTEADAVQSGKYGEWLKITGEPRYQMQQAKRNAPAVQPTLVAPASNRLNFGRSGSGLLSPIENGGIRRIGGRPVAGPEFGKGRLGVTIDKDWSMSIGTAPSATLTFTVSNNPGVGTVTGGTSTLAISGPAGFTTQTLTASAPVAAKQTGTFTGNPTNGQTVTLGGTEVLTASDSTAATGSGTFTGNPTTGQTVTVNGITLTASGSTDSTASGTFTGNPTTGQTTTVNGTVLTARVSAQATGTGNFSGNPTTGQTVTVNGVALTASDSTAATGAGTFTGNPTTGQTVVVNGVALTASDSTLSVASGTFTGNPTNLQTTTVNSVVLTANVSARATGTGTFSAEPTGAQTVTLGTTVLTIGSPSSTTILISTNPGNGVTIGTGTGGITYEFEGTGRAAFCAPGDRCVLIGASRIGHSHGPLGCNRGDDVL